MKKGVRIPCCIKLWNQKGENGKKFIKKTVITKDKSLQLALLLRTLPF